MAALLKEVRMSDFIRRQSDRERLSRVISPVLASNHRKEVYERIYGGAAISLIPKNASLPLFKFLMDRIVKRETTYIWIQ